MKMISKKRNIMLSLLTGCLVFAAGGVAVQNANAEGVTIAGNTYQMTAGAQMRKADPTGLRFETIIGAEKYTSIVENGAVKADKRLGMFIVPEKYFSDYATYKAENIDYAGTHYEYFRDVKKNIIDYTYSADQILAYEDGYRIRGSLGSILFNNTNLNFKAVSYIETTQGETVTYEFAENSMPRSIAYVASAALNNGETGESLDKYQTMAAYNALGVTYDSVSAKYSYDGTQYDTLEAIGVDPFTAYTIDTEEKVMTVNEVYEIKVNDALKALNTVWTSSNPDVATVENGKVTALKEGTTTITVKSGKIVKECTVTVILTPNGEPIIDLSNAEAIDKFVNKASLEGQCFYDDSIKFGNSGTMAVTNKGVVTANITHTTTAQDLKNYTSFSMWIYNNTDQAAIVNIGWMSGDIKLATRSWTCIRVSDKVLLNGPVIPVWIEGGAEMKGTINFSSIYSDEYYANHYNPIVDLSSQENIDNVITGVANCGTGGVVYDDTIKFGGKGTMKFTNTGTTQITDINHNTTLEKLNGNTRFVMWVYNNSDADAVINVGWMAGDVTLSAKKWTCVEFTAEALLNGPVIPVWAPEVVAINGSLNFTSIYAIN